MHLSFLFNVCYFNIVKMNTETRGSKIKMLKNIRQIYIFFFIFLYSLVSLAASNPEPAPADQVSKQTGSGSALDPDDEATMEPAAKKPDGPFDILIISKSDISKLAAGEFLRDYRQADAALAKRIEQSLEEHALTGRPADANKAKGDYNHELVYKLLNIEFGVRHPLGRQTNVTASYVFQKKDGTVLASGEFTEHSVKGWKFSVKALSQRIARDAAGILSGKGQASVKRSDAKDRSLQTGADKKIEERLKTLDDLKAKGLVNHEEYQIKREQILKDL